MIERETQEGSQEDEPELRRDQCEEVQHALL